MKETTLDCGIYNSIYLDTYLPTEVTRSFLGANFIIC